MPGCANKGTPVSPGKLTETRLARSPRAADSPAEPIPLSLVIPAWNEQETIRQAVEEAEAALAAVVSDYEILVVDDGSSDRTAEIVQALAAANPRVRLLRHAGNRGYGAALRTGFQAAKFELVAFTDADCQFDLSELAYLLPLTRRYAIACGCRIERQDPAWRRFFSWGYNTLARLLLGSPVHDINCALKVCRREALLPILPACEDFFANTEMLARAQQQGLTVVEVGVHHRSRAAGQSKVGLRDVPRTLAALSPFWWSRTLFPAPGPAPQRPGGWFWVCLLLLACLAGLLLFPRLAYPLVEPDEGRYAEIGREMLHRGDWLVPRLNGVCYYDKPPLLYWLVAGSLRLFGTHTWAARLVSPLAALLTVLGTFWFGSRVFGTRVGLLAAVVLALMVGFVQCGRFLLIDGVLTLLEALSLFAAYKAVRGRRLRGRWWATASLCCALGVLAKGPVALVAVAVPVAAYGWLNKNTARIRPAHWAAFVGLVLGLAAPWYIAMAVREPAFAWQFFFEHHLLRFFGPDYHEEPIWFYLPVLLVGCLPWSLLFVPLVPFLFSRSPALGSLRPQPLGFFLLWAGWCLSFFSLSRGKLPTYILPATPAIAVLLGWYLDLILFRAPAHLAFRQARTQTPRWSVVALAAIGLGGVLWAWSRGLVPAARQIGAVSTCGVCLTLIAGALLWGRKVPARPAWGLCALLGLALVLELTQGLVPAWSRQRSPVAQVRGLLKGGRVGVVCHGDDWGSVAFELDHDEDFLHTMGQPPARLLTFLAGHPRSLLFIKDDMDLGLLRQLLLPGKEVTWVIPSGKAQVLLVQEAGQGTGPAR